MRILAIETSCDETAISIVDFGGSKKRPEVSVLSNIVSSQVKLHAKFGGVVPNLAKREHQKNLAPILLTALKEAKFSNPKSQNPNSKQIPKSPPALKLRRAGKIQKIEKTLEREPELLKRFKKYVLPIKPPKIDAIAVTYGPGLAPALWVGVNFAKALAYLWDKPLIPVNHMEGHLFAALPQITNHKAQITNGLEFGIWNLEFPAVALLVSGGHTELVLMKKFGKYKIIGETLDDAAGEAFDKVARLLGLGYPGGPAISATAEIKSQNTRPRGQAKHKLQIKLPRPMINSKDFNFSFSGLKTAVLYLLRDLTQKYPLETLRPAVAKEFQDAVVEVLVKKTIRAAQKYKAKTILLGGGVAANKLLRERLVEAVKKEVPLAICHLPLASITGDNALMIALAAYFAGKKAPKSSLKIGAHANLRL